MSLFNSLKRRFTNQFLALIVYEESCKIKQKVIKNGKLIHKEEFNLEIKSKDELGGKVINFINALQDEYEHTYVALYLNTPGQGLIPGCDSSKLEQFHIDEGSVKTICKDGRFLMYATHIDVKWADKLFAKTGLDFVFSPFLILDFFIQQDMQKDSFNAEETVLYMLKTKTALAMMIQKGKRVLYGSFINTDQEENLLYTDFESDDKSDQLDELDLDNIDELEMNDILETGNQSHFATTLFDDEEVLSIEDERVIKIINTELKEFYENELYESEFITTARVYDDSAMGSGVLNFLEKDLLLNTHAQNISVNDAVLELAIREALEEDV